jgi:MFS family permease
MDKKMRWYDHITINLPWLGLNVASNTLTPLLLPYLVALFAPPGQKNTYLATLRVSSMAMAMMVQPIAGMLSDRSSSRWGRRRPYIFSGTMFDLVFLFIAGASPLFIGSSFDEYIQPILGVPTAYLVLLIGIILLQISSNLAHAALQGLIPDLVPLNQRGRASGVKAVMELLPAFLVIFIGPLVDAGKVWLTIIIISASLVITMLISVFTVKEKRFQTKKSDPIKEPIFRIFALTMIFVLTTQFAVWLVKNIGIFLESHNIIISVQVVVVGFVGLIGMAGAIFIGVYLGAWIGIGEEARQQSSFIWWIINRLLFLAAVGSISGFALYYLTDVLMISNAATATTMLLAVVSIFLMITAVGGGFLADKIGRKRLVGISGIIAAIGTFLLLFANDMPFIILCGSIIGIGAGTFMATNWALGTDLAPKEEPGRYLGISNLAGAGAGIIGTGIGGPMADFFNQIQGGLGYLVIFSIYGVLFLLSTITITRVIIPDN